jgi:acyl-CoA synthetase (AMP-forming)/AMP-acid ligase II
VAARRSIDFYFHLLALNGLGLSLVPVDLKASDVEITYVLDHSDSRMVVSDRDQVQRLRAAVAGHTGCRVATPNELSKCPTGPPEIVRGDPRREAALLYTSGTTGKPKGCILSNEYFMMVGRWYNELGGYCRLESGDRLLTPLPPTHMNALCVSFMAMLMSGGCVVQLDRFHPSTWWHTVRSEEASIVHYLGVMPAILLSLPETETDSFASQVRFGFGAGVDPRHHERFEQRFGFPLIEAWAMTETGGGAAVIAHKEPRHVGRRCFGRAPAEIEYRLVDDEGHDVVDGEPGELLVRRSGDQPRQGFYSGYHRDEAATEEAWRGGWFHTGDVVRAGSDGSLYFVDRRKNVIRRSGENISAVEVEMTLLQHDDVANCAVTAVPDELRGDEVFALIMLSPGSVADEQTAESVFEYCMERLSYFKVPAYIAWVEGLPLTASQKVSRKELKSAASRLLEHSHCFDFRERKKPRERAAG